MYEKWSPNGDEANYKAVLKVVQRFIADTSDSRFLSLLRFKSDLEDKSLAVNAVTTFCIYNFAVTCDVLLGCCTCRLRDFFCCYWEA